MPNLLYSTSFYNLALQLVLSFHIIASRQTVLHHLSFYRLRVDLHDFEQFGCPVLPEMSCYHIQQEPPLNYWTLNWPFTKVYPGQYWLQSFSIKILSQGNNGPIPQYPQLLLLLNSVGLSRITTSRATEILDLGKAGVHCAIHLSRGERIREGPRDLQVLVRNCLWWCWTGWQKTKIKTRPTLPNTKDYDSYIPLDSKHFDIFMKHL